MWWARRPLAACRAVLFAQLVDDPSSDPQYRIGQRVDEERAAEKRAELFNLIEDLVKWENSNNPDILNTARAEIARCVASRKIELGDLKQATVIFGRDEGQEHPNGPISTAGVTAYEIVLMRCSPEVVNHFLATYAPPVLDPFAGGGSIPLEAQRLGLRAHASDLNPVPVLINKALIEIPPKFAGQPPVNPKARSEWRGVRSERGGEDDALSRDDSMAKVDGGSARGVSSHTATAPGRDLRNALSNHALGSVDSGQRGGGLDARNRERQGAFSGNRSRFPGGDGNPADTLRRPGLVLSKRDRDSTFAAGRSESDADDHAATEKRSEERGVRRENFFPSHSSLLFPRSYPGAQGLAEDVRYYGEWMRNEAEKRIGHLYPKVRITQNMIDAGRDDLEPYLGQELTVIAWLWARTVASPDPSVGGTHVPLVRSFWLSKKKGKEAYIQPVVDRQCGTYEFTVKIGKPLDGFNPDQGTKSGRAVFSCLFSDTKIDGAYADAEANAGRMKIVPLAIVAEGSRQRLYLPPSAQEIENYTSQAELALGETEIPNEPARGTFAGNAQGRIYGFKTFGDYFTPRQLVALTTFSDLVSEARERVLADAHTAGILPDDDTPLDEGGTGPRAYADAVATYLGLALSRLSDALTSLTAWISKRDQVGHTFGRQALPMVWDYAESNLFNGKAGDFGTTLNTILRTLNSLYRIPNSGSRTSVNQRDVTSPTTYSGEIITTDPPYYDNVGYADLSDFFYVWLRRTLKGVYPSLLSTMLTPKAQELIASPYRHGGSKDKASRFFEEGLGNAIGKWCEHGHTDYPTTIFYAFKQAETDTYGTASTGWETFLTGVISSGFLITGTWPIRTERTARSTAMGTNALASSIVLSCVPRSAEAGLATRREFLTALTRELPDALRTLQAGNIAPVDLAQAAIGPGMALFSRYAKIIEADGSPMSVRTALALINQVLDEVLAEHEGEFDADTRWAVAWFEQHGMEAGDFGVAETLSKAKNTSVQGLVDAGVVKSRSGTVQLLSREELSADWDPLSDDRLTEWEATHYLIRALDLHGERGASDMLRTLGSDYGEKARALAYRLYNICERKKWASEATAYNSLVIAWPEMNRLALAGDGNEGQVQATLLE